MPDIAAHMSRLDDALSIRFNNRVYEMQAAGEDVIVLSLGEAFFDVPLGDFPRTDRALHYSHSRGVPALRDCIASDYYGVPIDPDSEIVVTAGSKIAIYLALLTMLDPGDEVIVPEPAWVSYTEQVRLCHGTPVTVPHDVPVTEWERHVTPRTRAIIVNAPNNPSGAMFGDAEWGLLHDLAQRRNLRLLCDEAYSEFIPRGHRFQSGAVGDPDKAHTVICNSLSKNFGMSGWRIGYVIAERVFIDQLIKAQQHLVTCAPTPLSLYVADHYHELRQATRRQIAAVVERRQVVSRALEERGIGQLPGEATFYVFASVAPSMLGSEPFCERLLSEHHVAAVPGRGYGPSCDGYIRLSVGAETLERTLTAVDAIAELISATSRRPVIRSQTR